MRSRPGWKRVIFNQMRSRDKKLPASLKLKQRSLKSKVILSFITPTNKIVMQLRKISRDNMQKNLLQSRNLQSQRLLTWSHCTLWFNVVMTFLRTSKMEWNTSQSASRRFWLKITSQLIGDKREIVSSNVLQNWLALLKMKFLIVTLPMRI